MARRPSADDLPSAQARSELAALVLRLERLRTELEASAADSAPVESALVEVAETSTRLEAHMAAFEGAIVHERELYRDLFNRAPDAYVVTDDSGRILEANSAASALVNRPPEEIVSKPLPLFVCDADRSRMERALRALSREPYLDFEARFDSLWGLRDVEVRAVAATDERTGRVLVRWILRDVTERRRAEAEVTSLNAELESRIAERTRELTEATALLETALRELPAAVVIADPSGRLLLANRCAETLLGAPFHELRERPLADGWSFYATDGRRLPPLEWPLARVLATGESSLSERVEAVRPDGVALLVEGSAVPVRSDDGAIASVVVTFHDVTERERRERAERDFITNAAHELQTPIAAITSAIEVLQAGAKERPADRDRFLDHIEHAADRLGRLTRALLVLARAQTREEPPRREVVPVEPFLREIAGSLPLADVAVECPADIAVVANRALLEQALTNLGENAHKYALRGVVLAARRENGRVAIDVRDSGPGIPVEERSRVFERFYRSDGANREGFGLGLAIVRESVEALGAELELESGPEGTRVSILLPGARVRTT